MASQVMRITLKAYDHQLVDQSAGKIIETVKKAEDSDDVVIRAYETWNKTTDCVYTFDRAPKSVYVCNLLEENEEQLEVSGNTVSLRFKPFEIKTVKVTF